MKKVFLSSIAAILFIAGGITAQDRPGISPEKVALVKELLEVTNTEEQSRQTIETMMDVSEEQTRSMIATIFDGDKTLSAKDKAQATEMATQAAGRAAASFKQLFLKEVDLAQLIDDVTVTMYAKHFTESELRDMIVFYRSPTGQKVIKVLPELMLDTMTAVSEKLTPILQDVMKKVIDQESAILKTETSKKKP